MYQKYMRDLRDKNIPKISESSLFELLCCDLWKSKSENELVRLNGRKGQSQDGVDVFGRTKLGGEWFGIQCKVRNDKKCLSKDEILVEVEKAKEFNPTLKELIICTTLDRDARTQEIVREINDELRKNNCFNLSIMFWSDIEELLKDNEGYNAFLKYYNGFFVDNTTLGHSIGKLINLELGRGNILDSHYELMIGKIPKDKNDTYYNVSYYKGTYFIINFNERKMETFPIPTYEGDLEAAFQNGYDRNRIANWLNSIKDLDSFIYEKEENYRVYISIEEEKEFYKKLNDDT